MGKVLIALNRAGLLDTEKMFAEGTPQLLGGQEALTTRRREKVHGSDEAAGQKLCSSQAA